MMESPSLSWSPQEFARLFPFHLIVDAETCVRQLGPSLQRMFPDVDVGQRLSHYFRIKRPNIAIDYACIVENCQSLFLLERLGNDVMLKGQMFPMDSGNMIVFLCSPWVTDLQQVRDLGISLTDFALHDPISDYLFLLQAKDTTLAESTKLQGELRAHREILEETVQQRTKRLRSEIAERRAVEEELRASRTAALDMMENAEEARARAERAEAELRQSNLTLEQRVLERTERLEAANKELEAFSYSVSHDLRAPLRAIDGFAGILLEEHAPQLSPEAARYVHLVRSGSLRMATLVDDVLALSHMHRVELELRSVALSEVAEAALEELSGAREGRKVEISVGPLPNCRGDPRLLKQVFVNLLDNALKFTLEQNVARIEIGCKEADGERVVYVRDNGVGFDMQYADKLFGVFERLHPREDYEGTGVGLATVQRIVHRHGWRVWGEAPVDGGAAFFFTVGGGGRA